MPTDGLDEIARLLAAATNAPDHAGRTALLAEARARLGDDHPDLHAMLAALEATEESHP